jgi:putative SOS response-associated peptidase YedK
MCNLYRISVDQQVIGHFSGALRDVAGNMRPLPAVYPDYSAPIIRDAPDGVREFAMARWGMPSPPSVLRDSYSDLGVTNVPDLVTPYWRRWQAVRNRCVVPFTSFSEIEVLRDGSRPSIWFALNEAPLAFFAGIWTRWTSVRKVREGATTNDVFGLLTTEPNGIVASIHPKAMPVILTERAEIETWLSAPIAEALKLQRPLRDSALRVLGPGRQHSRGEIP